jgi:hypothetical protein
VRPFVSSLVGAGSLTRSAYPVIFCDIINRVWEYSLPVKFFLGRPKVYQQNGGISAAKNLGGCSPLTCCPGTCLVFSMVGSQISVLKVEVKVNQKSCFSVP